MLQNQIKPCQIDRKTLITYFNFCPLDCCYLSWPTGVALVVEEGGPEPRQPDGLQLHVVVTSWEVVAAVPLPAAAVVLEALIKRCYMPPPVVALTGTAFAVAVDDEHPRKATQLMT